MGQNTTQIVHDEWVSFPGGELEGKRPKALCPSCREALERAASAVAGKPSEARARTLCFQCYRAEFERDRALQAAGNLDTASEERFQTLLPFEPTNKPRLRQLKADRAAARRAMQVGVGRYVDKRRHAQIDARHALQRIAAGLQARQAASAERERVLADAIHAAELQLPESWLRFVVSR